MNEILLILIAIYVISGVCMWTWVSTAYSRGGIHHDTDSQEFKNLNKTDLIIELLITLIPVFNTFWAIINWTLFCPKKSKKNSLIERFFRIKH